MARSGFTWFVYRTELGYREKPGQLPSEPGELLAEFNALFGVLVSAVILYLYFCQWFIVHNILFFLSFS